MPRVSADKLPKGIRKRNGKFQWDVTFKGVRKTGTAETLNQAIVDRAKAAEALREDQEIEGKKAWTLQRAYEGASAIKWNNSPSKHTTEINMSYVLEFFGSDTHLDKIDEEAIDRFRAWLMQKGNSNGTINRKTSALSVVLNYAYSRKGLTRLPVIGRLVENNTHERYVSRQEEKMMIDTCMLWSKKEHALTIIILVDTGMRSGELFKLRKDAIDFTASKHGVINIWKQNCKTKRSRTVPLTQRAATALKEMIKIQEEKDPLNENPLVCPYDRHWLRNIWDKAKEHIGLGGCEVFTPHLLRHTFGSRLAQNGIPIQKIGYLMGHTSIKTTMRYAHLCPQAIEGVIDVLEEPVLDDNSPVM